MLLLLVASQAMAVSPTEIIDIKVPQPCEAQAAPEGEVVVCANKNGDSPYRLRDVPPEPKRTGKAEIAIAEGVSAGAEVEEVNVGGFPSSRAMIRLKVKF